MSRTFKWLIGFLLLLIVWALSAPFLAKNLIVEKPLEKADAIVVLGGSHTYLERTRKAAELFKKGFAPRIYLTDDGEQAGWSRAEQRNPSFVELARKSLIAGGVGAENIEILEPKVTGTIYEARLLSDKARAANLNSILIVTSAYHTRRALATFQKIFAENNQTIALGILSPPPGEQTPPPFSWWLSKFGWEIVAGEYVKSVAYWIYY
jgi:uncharacterized SAM-binding protein YcdF (DUF218 family)